MSSDSPKTRRLVKSSKGELRVVIPHQVTDPSIIDSVAGFINDVVPTAYTTNSDVTDQIQWAHFEHTDVDELYLSTDYEKLVPPPLVLVLGYSTGVQVWLVGANGDATEIIAWRHGSIRILRLLPSPQNLECTSEDSFASKRPLMAVCDSTSPGPPFCALNFISVKTGEQVKLIKFKNQVLDVKANKQSIVVCFSEKIAVFDSFTLADRCTITNCYLSPGVQANPVSLGARWLAYAERSLVACRKSGGGSDNEGVQSYKATVIQCAKSLGKGIKEFGESVANSLTGSSNFKPGVVCPGSPQSGGLSDTFHKGVVTVLDLECTGGAADKTLPTESIVAHFVAHNEAIVAMDFDPSGMLLLTADRRGYDFHVFRLHPHPVSSNLASVHHLYVLHRGDTTAKVQDMCFSPDSRWVTISTLRGTTHVFPITPYGGNVGVRTHTTQHVVNKMSRFHRSAGLTGDERSSSPVSGLEFSANNVYPYTNPRQPPFPHPTIIHPLAQIRQPVTTAHVSSGTSSNRSAGTTRQRLSSHSDDSLTLGVVACFAPARGYIEPTASQEQAQKKQKTVESLFVMGSHGSLIQYDLEPHPVAHVPREKLCDDTAIELKTSPTAQWVLQRSPTDNDVPLPLRSEFIDYFSPAVGVHQIPYSRDNDDYWLSQVEIVTHSGPHRRLWMGPQFTFKTYTTKAAGCPFSLTNIQKLDIGRSKPINMPVTQNAVFIECGSANSRELSPPMNTYHATFDEITGMSDLQLKEDLADAMLESPGTGGRCVIVSLKQQATPVVAKAVNPLGKVVTIQSDDDSNLEEQQCEEEAVIHENCDEALFRPIVAPKPVKFKSGRQPTDPMNTMIVRNLDDTTGVAVEILDRGSASNKSTGIVKPKQKDCCDYEINPLKLEMIDEVCCKPNNLPKNDRPSFPDIFNYEPMYRAEFPPPDQIVDKKTTFKDRDFDFANMSIRNSIDRDLDLKTADMFEDASDCYDDNLYINTEKGRKDEDKVTTTAKPRKPKAKLGVRIPNRNFQEDESIGVPKRSWSSVAAIKPKEKIDISEKENCELLDLSHERSSKKCYNSNVKLIRIETPADENAPVEIVEPGLMDYRKNSWYSNVLEKSSDEEKIIDVSTGETTESDDSGKLTETLIKSGFIMQSITQSTGKSTKKKSKKKRK